MVGHGGSSAGSYLADPTSSIPSHYASIVVTSTARVNGRPDLNPKVDSPPFASAVHVQHNQVDPVHQPLSLNDWAYHNFSNADKRASETVQENKKMQSFDEKLLNIDNFMHLPLPNTQLLYL